METAARMWAELRAAFDQAFQAVPDWAVSLGLFLVVLIAAFVIHRFVYRLLTRWVARRDLFWRSLVSRGRFGLFLAIAILSLMAASAMAPLSGERAGVLRHLLAIGLIGLLASVVRTALHIWVTVYQRRFKLDAEDNLLARQHVTQTRILRRVADFVIVVIALGAILMTFEGVRQYGISLLASAGAAGIILGLALQTVLKNLFAGIQLAITQPIRIDDVVIVEGEWGNIEEITAAYVVVRIWDWRRLIVPLSYFIENPFQNWTRESASIIGAVVMPLDYAAPVEAIRAKARAVVEGSPLWDGSVFAVQVTDFKTTTMDVRVIVGARNAGQAFELRCILREQLVRFLQKEHPYALPRTRLDLTAVPERGSESEGDALAGAGEAGPR